VRDQVDVLTGSVCVLGDQGAARGRNGTCGDRNDDEAIP
jgi:hypothetical protein